MFPALYNEVKIFFVFLIRNVYETVTKVSKENGFHGNLVTKQKNVIIVYQGYLCILLFAENRI